MSFPNIPDVSPDIDINREDVINLLLASIAFEELGLSHIINAEAEKIQFVVGTLEIPRPPVEVQSPPVHPEPPTIEDLLEINSSVEQTLRSVIKTQMLLQFKLEDIIDFSQLTTTSTTSTTSTTTTTTTSTTTESTTTTTTESTTTTTTESTTTTTTESTTTTTTESTTTTSTTSTTTTTTYSDVGSAWSVGIDFGEGNAQYTTIGSDETEKTVVLGLGSTYIPVGTVQLIRSTDNLEVTITVDLPYVMDQVHLYVDNVAPTNSAPGSFPYQYTVTDPADYFVTRTFNVAITDFIGETIYVAAHAHLLEQV